MMWLLLSAIAIVLAGGFWWRREGRRSQSPDEAVTPHIISVSTFGIAAVLALIALGVWLF